MRIRHIVILTLLAGCQCESLNEDRQMPKPAPPPSAAQEASFHIPVTVGGKARAPIDREMLSGHKPDFEDSERRAWRLVELLGIAADGPISVTGERGVTVVLRTPPPADSAAPVPVLIVSRRGELLAAMVDPAEPFPPYHGQGGRRGRRGDPLPRIGGVTRIDVGPSEDAQPE